MIKRVTKIIAVGIVLGIFSLVIFGGRCWALGVYRDLSERAKKADSIIVGTVVEQRSEWRQIHSPQVGDLVFTNVKIQVTESWKSPAGEKVPEELVVRVPGGRNGRFVVRVSEMPRFRDSEKVVLFLRKSKKTGVHQLVAGSQGAFRFQTEPDSKREVLINEAGEFLVDVSTMRFERNPAPQNKVTLEQLHQYLKESLSERQK